MTCDIMPDLNEPSDSVAEHDVGFVANEKTPTPEVLREATSTSTFEDVKPESEPANNDVESPHDRLSYQPTPWPPPVSDSSQQSLHSMAEEVISNPLYGTDDLNENQLRDVEIESKKNGAEKVGILDGTVELVMTDENPTSASGVPAPPSLPDDSTTTIVDDETAPALPAKITVVSSAQSVLPSASSPPSVDPKPNPRLPKLPRPLSTSGSIISALLPPSRPKRKSNLAKTKSSPALPKSSFKSFLYEGEGEAGAISAQSDA